MDTATEILRTRGSYALVGASANRERYSFELLETLRDAGYTVYPVNPGYAEIEELPCYPSLADLPARPDVAICALAPHNTEQVVDQVSQAGIPVVWMPPDCGSEAAAAAAERAGLTVVRDVCPIGLLVRMRLEQE